MLPKQTFPFVSQGEITGLSGLSLSTLKRYRRENRLIEGVHWVRVGRQVRFNLELFQDWLANQSDKQAHLRAIEAYQASLLSNQPSKAGRKLKTPKTAA